MELNKENLLNNNGFKQLLLVVMCIIKLTAMMAVST